jgi:DNA-binding transcriptional LysR family regulator
MADHHASLDELQAFVTLTETGSFTAAAKRLRLSTNAVSQRVRRIEARLGVALFVRTTRSVRLTPDGEALRASVVPLLSALEQAQDELRGRDARLRGRVRLAVPGALATLPLLARLRGLLDAHPELEVELRVVNRGPQLAAQGLDVAVWVGTPPDSGFVARKLGDVAWVLAAAPSYLDRRGRPRTPAELAHHRCLRFLDDPPQESWRLQGPAGVVHVAVSGGFECDDSRTLGDATYEGLGIGLRPLGECTRAQLAGALERVLPDHHMAAIPVHALIAPGRARTQRITALIDVLRAALSQLA